MKGLHAAVAPLALAAIVATVALNKHEHARPHAHHRVHAAALDAVPPADRFGINAQVLFWQMPPSVWPQHVREMRQDGISVVRTDAFWDSTEPQPPVNGVHDFRWDRLDSIVAALARERLRWLPIADYSTPWAASRRNDIGQPLLYSPPRSDADYANYVQAVARRYGPGGEFWRQHPELAAMPVHTIEIWNEENGPVFWYPAADPAAYARLYEAARAAVHRVDGSIEVLVGGLANPSGQFLQGMYATLGGAGRLDGVAIHPYAPSAAQMLPDVVLTRQILDSHGDIDVPIDVTEFGWATHGPPTQGQIATDPQRATYLQQFTDTIATSDCGVERILPHSWTTLDRDYNNPEDWYGLTTPNATPTSSASAYASVIAQLATRAPAASASTCGRSLSLQVAPLTLAPQIVARPTRSRHRHKKAGGHRRGGTRAARHRATRKRRHPVRVFGACARTRLDSGATAVDGATVTFVLSPAPGVVPTGPLTVVQRSDSRGVAQACWSSRLPGAGAVSISASRRDFARAASGSVALRWG